jgi:hypothetical protein
LKGLRAVCQIRHWLDVELLNTAQSH